MAFFIKRQPGFFRAALSLWVAFVVCPAAVAAAGEEQSFQPALGDSAPGLKAARLIKGEAIPGFEPGRTYVVEFWATWCEPCKKFMPHLSQMARQYRGKVPFISVSVYEDRAKGLSDADLLKRVKTFVKGQGEKMDYIVAMDDASGTIATEWMKRFGESGIPRAFIVSDSKVVWIGEPMDMEEPLARIVNGTYDMRVAILERYQKKEDMAEMSKLWNYEPLKKATESKDYAAQLKIYEQAFAMNPRLESLQYGGLFPMLLHVDKARALTYVRNMIDAHWPAGKSKSRSTVLNKMAGLVIEEDMYGDPDCAKLVLDFAQEALELDKTNPRNHSTLADRYFRRGEVAKAIERQKHAITLVEKIPSHDPSREKTVQSYRAALEKYEAGKSTR